MLCLEVIGYGFVYFIVEMFNMWGEIFRGKIVVVLGLGNVVQFVLEKVLQFGGKVVILLDLQGIVYDYGGLDKEKIEYVKWLKNVKCGCISEYVEKFFDVEFFQGKCFWFVKCDVVLFCVM